MNNKLTTSTPPPPKFQELTTKLREIFQIDRPELDFGIYRILNARADEINDYLDHRLAEKVRAALATGGAEHENAVFSHLLTFFSRYYQSGDFISQRRYKGDTYAIPYAGEEVVLHWANKDQYYTKSGENFSNYSFKMDDGRVVHFRLVAADTAKDNRKDNEKDRLFALVREKTLTRTDDQGNEYDEQIFPIEEVDGNHGKELILRFEYTAQPKGTKQDALIKTALDVILNDDAVKARWLHLAGRAPTEKNPQRTLLEKHLTNYTTKNSADYFIHKDLGGFLRRELDFYIKNEVMHLDDVQNANAFTDIEKNLRMIQCLRAIGLELISFLAQLEDFQKKLWLKKKFVVSSHYCMTLDRVPKELWPEVVANERQWAAWKQLGLWDDDTPGTIRDLNTSLYRMVDTRLFASEFKDVLLQHTSKLELSTNGIIIRSENSHALRLLHERYRKQITGVYIDPPYNTGGDGLLYRDGYQESSWMSMILERLKAGTSLLSDESALFVSIDEHSNHTLKRICRSLFGESNEVGEIAVCLNPKGRQLNQFFATSHEYLLVYAKNSDQTTLVTSSAEEIDQSAFPLIENGVPYRLLPLRNTNNKFNPQTRPNLYYPLFINPNDGSVSTTSNQDFIKVYPVFGSKEPAVWRWGKPKSEVQSGELLGRVVNGREGERWDVFQKDFCPPERTKKLNTFWASSDAGSTDSAVAELKALGCSFTSPKPTKLVTRLLSLLPSNAVCLDYFAGSGTTGHSVISLNRQDGGMRNYILTEQADYADTLIKPRLQKIVYSSTWKDGKPTAPETGISHCFKVLKLESYEDTLNNLQLRRTATQRDLLKELPAEAQDDYRLHYMLDVESRGSLLSIEDFKKPFDYKLNIAVDSAGAYEPHNIDLVETFNYLIGLQVDETDTNLRQGYATVKGTLPNGESCLVLWRDCETLGYEAISKLCDRLRINPSDNEFDVIYINGDHNIPTVLTQTTEEGGATRVLKLRQIEEEFLRRMFDVEDV